MTPELHPLTQKYPPMEAEEFAAFLADLAAHGQKNPIWLFEGKVLDGRNRLRACRELGREPVFAAFAGTEAEAAAFVDSQNLHRRHLSREWRQQQALEMRSRGQSTRTIARELGCDPKTVWRDLSAANGSASSLTNPDPVSVGARAPTELAPPVERSVGACAPTEPVPPVESSVGARAPTESRTPNPMTGVPDESLGSAVSGHDSGNQSAADPKKSRETPRVTGSDGKRYRAQKSTAPKSKPTPPAKAQWTELASVLTELARKVETLVPTPAENERPWELISSLEATARSLLRQAERLKRRHHL